MAIDTKVNLSSNRFEQIETDYLCLGGHNCICGTNGTLSSNSGYGISGVTILSTGTQIHAIRLGCNASAGSAATALGSAANSGGNASVAVGCASCSNGTGSVSVGSESRTYCNCSTIIGYGNTNCAEGSSILGGYNNMICNGNTNTTLIGATGITLAGSSYANYVVVPNLAIMTAPSGTGNYLCYNSSTKKIERTTGGGVTGATNLGTGNGTIFTTLNNNNIQLKSLSGGTNVTLTCNGNYIGINSRNFVDSISSGCGMNFSTISSTGAICLGTPSTICNKTIDFVSGTTHSHCFKSTCFITGTGGILVNGDGQFYIDNSYVTNATLPNLYTITGITSNRSIGVLASGQTLGMVYITNSGSATAYVNLGTTPTGDEITPYSTIAIPAGEDVSATVNMRLSPTLNKTIYISSDNWTNVVLKVQWANITYQNASTTITPSDLPMASSVTLGAIKVGSGLTINSGGTLYTNLTLDGLTNVIVPTPSTGNVLVYNGSNWINSGVTISSSLSSLTDVSITSPTKNDSLVYNGTKWINTGNTSGGFLGMVTKTTAKISNAKNNQWVKPAPTLDNVFSYTFDNFCDGSALPINVNLSLEDVYLRYHDTGGGYWSKESYSKPISYCKAWVGDVNNRVCEVSVVDEWVYSEASLQNTGQKFAYDTQTIMMNDLSTCIVVPNYIMIKNINLKTVGTTLVLTVPTGKAGIITSAKLIILNDASPTTFTISMGTNSSTYNNISPLLSISNVLTNEYYDLTMSPKKGSIAGSNVYFRVATGSTSANALCAHLLVQGIVY